VLRKREPSDSRPHDTGFPLPRGRRKYFDWTTPVSLAFVLMLSGLVLLPMAWLLIASFRDDASRITLDNYRQFFTDASFLKPLLTTLWTSAAVGFICVALAAPSSSAASNTPRSSTRR